VGKSWLEGIQCNMLEGATGDISITGANPKYGFRAQAEERPAGKKAGLYWKDGAPARAFGPGSRLLWFGRDPSWENVLGFRGKNDVEKTAMKELGKERGTEFPRAVSGRLKVTGFQGSRAGRQAILFRRADHRLAILVHQGSDPTPPYQAWVIRKSATLFRGFAPWGR
jgi:hypothetical protein